MRIFTIIIFSVLVLSSCATVFSPGSQDVTFINPNPETKIYVDSLYINKGTQVVANIEKDMHVKQIRFEQDSFKTEYRAFMQTHVASLYYLSWIPFGVFFLVPPLYDQGPKSWVYEDEFVAPKLTKYKYWTPNQKKLYISNFSIDVKKENFICTMNSYSDYLDNEVPDKTKAIDSLKVKNSYLEEIFYNILKKTNYSDTTYHAIIDNKNTVYFSLKLNKIVINQVYNPRKVLYLSRGNNYEGGPTLEEKSFLETNVTSDFILKDPYGDTLLTIPLTGTSGQFSLADTKYSQAFDASFNDALESMLIKFMDDPNFVQYLKADTSKFVTFENLNIKKPTKTPKNIEDAMKATFTIKADKVEMHGSGFLISNDGYIITNHHVISNKNYTYKAISNDGKEYDVKVVRSNKIVDLALLKIEGDFEFAYNIPNEKNFKIGDELYAIGTPKSLELGQSVSKGIVSSIRKNNDNNFIQMNMSVNGGNSGGPVISNIGDLFGVVEYKLAGSTTEGISFSIPAYEINKALGISF